LPPAQGPTGWYRGDVAALIQINPSRRERASA